MTILTASRELNQRINRLRRWNIEVREISLKSRCPVITIDRPLPGWERNAVDVFVHVVDGLAVRQLHRSLFWAGVCLKWPVH